MPESPYPMIPVEEAVQIVVSKTKPLPTLSVRFEDALGLVLAEDVRAAEPMPPFPASAVDGYAVLASDEGLERECVGEQTAGHYGDLTVSPGEVIQVTTGAPLPTGADAVVMVEYSEALEDSRVRINTSVDAGENVRPVGQDLEQGQLVLASGVSLGAPEIGLLAMVGQTQVQVFPRPKVAVMSTGDELVDPGADLKPGQIRDSNRYTMMSAVREAGAIPVDMGRIADQPDAVRKVMQAVTETDALVTTGGVSMGQLDLVKPFLASHGIVHFGRVRAKPGKPMTFATLNDKAVFALPGFPVSALVAFELYVRPALRKMAGHNRLHRERRPVVLGHEIFHSPARTEFQRAFVSRHSSGNLVAATTGFQGSGRLLSLSGANALLVLPLGQEHFPEGSRVDAILLGQVEEPDSV